MVTGPGGAVVTSLNAYVGTIDPADKRYGLAIYADSGGKPGALVTSATGTLGAAGWQALPLAANLAANTAYWLVYNTGSDNAHNLLYRVNGPAASGGWSTSGVTCCAFPASAPAWTLFGNTYAIYAGLGSSSPTSTPTSTSTETNTAIPPTATSTATPSSTPTATLTATSTTTSTQTPLVPDTTTATATATATALPSNTPTPAGVLGPYGCLYPGVIYQFNSTLTGPTGVVWTSPPTPYTVDPGGGPACTPGGLACRSGRPEALSPSAPTCGYADRG